MKLNLINRPLFTIGIAISTLLVASLLHPFNINADLVSHWRFNEAPGSTTAVDGTGSYDGTLLGGAAFVGGGIDGNAISLTESTGSLVDMGSGFPAFTVGNFSLSAWVNTTTTEDTSMVLARHSSGSTNGYFLNLNTTGGFGASNRAMFYGSNVPGQEVISTTSVNDGTWHHIVAVHSEFGTQSIYVDGIPFEDVGPVQDIHDFGASFLVGGINLAGTPTAYFTGLIDDVQVYDHALDDNEINFLFDNPGQSIPEPSKACVFALIVGSLFGRCRPSNLSSQNDISNRRAPMSVHLSKN